MAETLGKPGTSLKITFNESGAMIFPITSQHREHKLPGVVYEDDSKGNALAGLITHNHIEVRHHQKFSDARVVMIVSSLISDPMITFAVDFEVIYGGKRLKERPRATGVSKDVE